MKSETTHTPHVMDGPFHVICGSACAENGADGFTIAQIKDGGNVLATHIPTEADAEFIMSAIEAYAKAKKGE